MAETYTSNLGLVKPDYDSFADISVINSNMDKIDNAVANAGKVKSVNKKTGDVTLTAADVGALPSDGTAVNANALNGKSADQYATADSVNQLSQRTGDAPERYNGLGLKTVDLNIMRSSCVFLALNCENAPTSSEWYTVAVFSGGTGSSIQIAAGSFNASLWFRHNNGEAWGNWIKIAGE